MDKMAKVMGEFKGGTLHSGSSSGPKVKARKQAIAIAMNEARGAGQKVAPPPQAARSARREALKMNGMGGAMPM